MNGSLQLPGRRRFISPPPAAQVKIAGTARLPAALSAVAAVASLTFAVLLFTNR